MMQVGDIIEKGATSIPPEVLELLDVDQRRDVEESKVWRWVRVGDDLFDYVGPGGKSTLSDATRVVDFSPDWFPLTVTKVAPPAPLVLSLPEVPEGAVALVGKKTGERFPVRWRQGVAEVQWQRGMDGGPDLLGAVLEREESVTVEFAPPREPRTWPKLNPAPMVVDGELPQYVTVAGYGTWGCREDRLYAETDGYADDVDRRYCLNLRQLRELGDVTEVLD